MSETLLVYRFFQKFFRPHIFMMLIPIAFALLLSLQESITPYILKMIIDEVSALSQDNSMSWGSLITYGITYVLLIEMVNILFRLKDYFKMRVFPQVKSDIMLSSCQKIMNQPYRFFIDQETGGLVNCLLDATKSMEILFNMFIDALLWRSCSLLLSAAILATVSVVLSGLVLLWAVFFVMGTAFFARHSQCRAQIFALSRSAIVGRLTDTLSNMINVILFYRQERESAQITEALAQHQKKERALLRSILYVGFFQGAMVTLFTASIMALLIQQTASGHATTGDFAFVLMLAGTQIRNVYSISADLLQFFKEIGVCVQAIKVINLPQVMPHFPDARALVVRGGEIHFKSVCFHYPHQSSLFTKLNVRIPAGQRVGIVGYSGAGKTTFINLLMRLYDVVDGGIFIDGQEISQLTLHSLRENIVLISQEPVLFNRSILENIRYSRPEARESEVILAAQKAHCHDFIMTLPEQYSTVVGERGVKLSGGQKQRLALARALLSHARIILLDEPTSALDAFTEKLLQRSLDLFFQGRTVLVIAHRFSTVQRLERLLVFDKGRVVADGCHQDLISERGIYQQLWQNQQLPLPQEELC